MLANPGATQARVRLVPPGRVTGLTKDADAAPGLSSHLVVGMVRQGVVPGADQDSFVEVGLAALAPWGEVVGVRPRGGTITTLGRASEALANRHRSSL